MKLFAGPVMNERAKASIESRIKRFRNARPTATEGGHDVVGRDLGDFEAVRFGRPPA